VLLMLERLFDHILSHPGASFCTFETMAEHFRQRYPKPA
jgi:hypothetical protein